MAKPPYSHGGKVIRFSPPSNAAAAGHAATADHAKLTGHANKAGHASKAARAAAADHARQASHASKVGNARQASHASKVGNARQTGNARQAGNASLGGHARLAGNARPASHARQVGRASTAPSRDTARANARPRSLLALLLGSSKETKLLTLFCLVALALVFRLSMLSVIDGPALASEAKEKRTGAPVVLTAQRGTIYDRNGNILATSVEATTIYADPSKIKDVDETAAILAEVLGGNAQTYADTINNSMHPTFVYIVKLGDTKLANMLKEKNRELREVFIDALPEGDQIPAEIPTALTGIDYLTGSRRDYPYGRIGAQIIGAVDDDGNALCGLEKTYDSLLRGQNGSMSVERARDGSPIVGGALDRTEPINGQDIITTVDIEMQQHLEESLLAAGRERQCANADALMLDGATGEILAVASLPLYERGNLSVEDSEQGATTLKSITKMYEPGSIFKPVTAAAALESDSIRLDEEIYCPAYFNYDEYTVSDAVERGDEVMTLPTMIAKSSNVGMSIIEARLGNEAFATYLQRYGFGQLTHVDYPGEGFGLVADVGDWSAIQAANISFGQGVQVTPLQMAAFYGAIANGGIYRQPHFLMAKPRYDAVYTYDAKTIIKADTAEKLEQMLRLVVTDGTGKSAAIDGYEVVGKTGTGEKAAPEGGYYRDQYVVSFVGYIANTDSKLVCLTSFDNPIDATTASPCGPLFKDLMSFAIGRYVIAPQSS